jgi:hypothetical protein
LIELSIYRRRELTTTQSTADLTKGLGPKEWTWPNRFSFFDFLQAKRWQKNVLKTNKVLSYDFIVIELVAEKKLTVHSKPWSEILDFYLFI